MRTVRLHRDEFLAAVERNRDNHRTTFERALAGYREHLLAELERRIRDATANFIAEQPDRFSVMAVDGVEDPAYDDIQPLLGVDFAGGVMTWLASLTEALLLRSFEQASGYKTAVLSDERLATVPLNGPGGGYHDSYVVLSSRPFANCWDGCDRC